MIAKGTTHDSGGRLASYLITGKIGERAELWQLKGFASEDIKAAFRSVHVMAAGTRCQQPFFHVQVRNPEDEHLTRAEWERVANRVESKLGLTDQPRAIAFHRDLKTGHEHMHIAWSRIDDETMTAKSLPFFKLRLKEVSRALETELGLTPVSSERAGPVMAPRRDEEEQARRLNVELRDVRQTIREAWERSDSGQSFRTALADEGLTLAKGDKRDFIVIDQEGGMHALSKRIIGTSAAETRARTADLDRTRLPTIEEAREQAALVKAIGLQAAPEPRNVKKQEPEICNPAEDAIRLACQQANSSSDFIAALNRNGIRLAVVNAVEAQEGNRTASTREIVGVDKTGQVHELSSKMTGADRRQLEILLGQVDHRELGSIEKTQQQNHLEIARFIELTRVGSLSSVKTKPQQEATIDWKRLLTDADYRRELREKRDLEQTSQQHCEQARSRERDRR